ncbi:unnamed protein product [Rotaria sp. Silwood2]|nr:unnamed protein product [Rotaria sp. Silwood2]
MFCINELGKQLEEIEATRDLIQQTIIQRTENRKQHTLLKKIDQLEQESIVKIRQVTEEVDMATSDLFERTCDNAQIQENGCLVVKDGLSSHTEIRGKNEYNTGRHKFSFRIEQLASSGWIFFGIISKSESTNLDSYYSSSSYGWLNQNQMYVGGEDEECQENIEIIENDTITFFIDCDQKRFYCKMIC